MTEGDAAQKASGQPDNDILAQFNVLVDNADIITLREIVKVTSNLINSKVYPRAKVPSKEELDDMFKICPNIFDTVGTGNGSSHNTRSTTQSVESDLTHLQTELDSLGLCNSQNSNKVRTKWLIPAGTSTTHRDLQNAEDISHYPEICKLRDCINKLPDCQGTLDGCIVNCYQSTSSRLRPHSDDEPYIDQNCSIATFSLGGTREFGIFTKSHRSIETQSF